MSTFFSSVFRKMVAVQLLLTWFLLFVMRSSSSRFQLTKPLNNSIHYITSGEKTTISIEYLVQGIKDEFQLNFCIDLERVDIRYTFSQNCVALSPTNTVLNINEIGQGDYKLKIQLKESQRGSSALNIIENMDDKEETVEVNFSVDKASLVPSTKGKVVVIQDKNEHFNSISNLWEFVTATDSGKAEIFVPLSVSVHSSTNGAELNQRGDTGNSMDVCLSMHSIGSFEDNAATEEEVKGSAVAVLPRTCVSAASVQQHGGVSLHGLPPGRYFTSVSIVPTAATHHKASYHTSTKTKQHHLHHHWDPQQQQGEVEVGAETETSTEVTMKVEVRTPEEFVPSYDWQPLHPWHTIPSGLETRYGACDA
jgi:hypothetical protein